MKYIYKWPVVFVQLAFFFPVFSSTLFASPVSFLWGESDFNETSNIRSPGIFTSYNYEQWSKNESLESGGYEYLSLISMPTYNYLGFVINLDLGKQSQSYDLTHTNIGELNWVTQSTKTIGRISTRYQQLELQIQETLHTKSWGVLLHLNDILSLSFDKKEEDIEYDYEGKLSSESGFIQIDIPQNTSLEWRLMSLFIDYKNFKIIFKSHITDNENINQTEQQWQNAIISYKPSSTEYLLELLTKKYPIQQQNIFFDGIVEGISSGDFNEKALALRIKNNQYNQEFNMHQYKLSTLGLFNAQALSDHFLNPFLGPGRYKTDVQVESVSYLLTPNPNFIQSSWNYGVGLGYMTLDGLNDQILYANPFGIFKKSVTPLNIESALWGIFHFNYKWQKNNIQVNYRWQQIIPFKIKRRNDSLQTNSSASDTSSSSSTSLEWPLNGSKHIIELNYLFD